MQAHRKALFLDRDGVINVDKGYVCDVQDIDWVPGIFELCKEAVARDYVLIVVTNQSGIGRGYYSEEAFLALTDWIHRQFKAHDAPITQTYYCPYHPTKGVGTYLQDSWERKPNPGMIERAMAEYTIEPTQSLLIGDKLSDMQAAQAAGIAHQLLLRDAIDETLPSDTIKITSLIEAKKYL